MRNTTMNDALHNIENHVVRYFVKNAVIYNLIIPLVILGAAYIYLVQRFGLELILMAYKSPSFTLLLSTGVIIGTLIGVAIWFSMLFIPYVTIGTDCLSYKVAPIGRRRFIEFQYIISYKVSTMFFTLTLVTGEKIRIGLYGVTHKKAMIQSLSSTLDRAISANNQIPQAAPNAIPMI